MRVDADGPGFRSDELIQLLGVADDDVVRRKALPQERLHDPQSMRNILRLSIGPGFILQRPARKQVRVFLWKRGEQHLPPARLHELVGL